MDKLEQLEITMKKHEKIMKSLHEFLKDNNKIEDDNLYTFSIMFKKKGDSFKFYNLIVRNSEDQKDV
jgi:hypothetical protein